MRASAVAFASSLLLLSASAFADPPALPWPFPLPPPPAVLPNVPGLDVNALVSAAQSCPRVEVAPGIWVPMPCALPKVPEGAPVVELPTITLLPGAVDLRAQGLEGPVKDQKQTGVCYAFALTTALESSLRKQGRADVLSPLHVIAADTWDALWSDRPKEAIADESVWPYDPAKACRLKDEADSCEQAYGVAVNSWQSDPALVAERERARASGVAMSSRASKLTGSTEQIARAIAGGKPVYVNVGIDSAAWSWSGVKGGVISDYARADRGGHAVVLVAFRPSGVERAFLVHNSWGARWGDGGYAWIPEHVLASHLESAFLVDAVPTGPALPVATPPTLAPSNACAAGSALDLGTGKCAALCPSGLVPFGGRCWLG